MSKFTTKRCIYCYSFEKSRNLWKGEHVVPKQLGGPDAYQLREEVCPVCNGRFGETIENIFKQNTPEGYLACMYQLGRGSGFLTSGGEFDVIVTTDIGELSPDIFFHIDLVSERLNIPRQITLRAGRKRSTIFGDVTEDELRKKLKWLRTDTIDAVSYGLPGTTLEALGQVAGLTVSRMEPSIVLPAGTNLGQIRFQFNSMMNRTIKRVAAKTAFNYLAYCAAGQYTEVLLGRPFDALRKFCLLTDDDFKKQLGMERTLVTDDEARITYCGDEIRMGRPFHSLRLSAEQTFVDGAIGLRKGYYDLLPIF